MHYWSRFRRSIGLKQPIELEMHEIRDAQMRSQYIGPIENFLNQIDKLLDVISRVCSFDYREKVLIFVCLDLYESKAEKNLIRLMIVDLVCA